MLWAVDFSAIEGMFGAFALVATGLLTFIATKLTNAAAQEKRIGLLTEQVFKLTDKNQECEIRCTNQTAELQRAFQRIMHLEKYSGIGPGDPLIGVIIANTQGIIQEFSPTLTPLFRWKPGEVIGKSIFLLMPNDIRNEARTHLSLYGNTLANRTELDSKKIILTEGLTKSGTRFPITLSLRGWPGGDLITATIRERDMALPTISAGAVARKTSPPIADNTAPLPNPDLKDKQAYPAGPSDTSLG